MYSSMKLSLTLGAPIFTGVRVYPSAYSQTWSLELTEGNARVSSLTSATQGLTVQSNRLVPSGLRRVKDRFQQRIRIM